LVHQLDGDVDVELTSAQERRDDVSGRLGVRDAILDVIDRLADEPERGEGAATTEPLDELRSCDAG
jgi:hypothetical protein